MDNPYSDSKDSFKWDFDQSSLKLYRDSKGYPYLTVNMDPNSIRYLLYLRYKINNLCENILNDPKHLETFKAKTDKYSIDLVDNFGYYLDIFLDIHMERDRTKKEVPEIFNEAYRRNRRISKYVISEIPKGTKFNAINKPRERYMDSDGERKARYRHILIDLSNNDVEALLIHELAHSMANHVLWVDDNHHSDFKACEKFIQHYWG
jgi:hypothetical protein